MKQKGMVNGSIMKKFRDICKPILRIASVTLICTLFAAQTVFAVEINSYTYIRNGEGTTDYYPVPAPAPYNYERSINAKDLGVESLDKLNSLFVTDRYVYISSGASIIITDHKLNTVHVIKSYTDKGSEQPLTEVNGLFVTKEGELYACLPESGLIIEFNSDWTTKRVLGRPEGLIISGDVKYQPLKIVVDSVGRMYVVANNVYEGVLELNIDGTFSRYFGTVPVKYTAIELFWRNLQTAAQRAKSAAWLPQNFSNLAIDADDFVYATVAGDNEKEPIKKFNAKGTNILRFPASTKINPHGDLYVNKFGFRVPIGESQITAIDINKDGVYVALDARRGHVFAYDDDGYMLYAFGDKSLDIGRAGEFKNPVDIKLMDDNLLIADRGNMSIEVYSLNDYGKTIHQAVQYQMNSDYRRAADEWKKVLDYNPTFQYGYVGIGKALYRDGDYKTAQQYFLLGQDVEYYSQAFKKNRQDFFSQYFPAIASVIVLIFVGQAALKIVKKRRLKKHTEGV